MKITGDGGHAAVIREFYRDSRPIIAVGDNAAKMREAINRSDETFGVAIHQTAWSLVKARRLEICQL